jgi:hypothetical protein
MKRAGGAVLVLVLAVLALVAVRSRLAPPAETSHVAGAVSPAVARVSGGNVPPGAPPVGETTRTLPFPSFKKVAKVPIGYRRMPEGRQHISDEKYGEWLDEPQPWKGRTPTSIVQLPNTPTMKAKLEEISAEDLDFRLKLLSDLDTCFKRARIPEGSSAVVTFFFDYVDDKAVAKEPVLEATTLPKQYDVAFMTCLQQSFAGKSFPLQREGYEYMHAWPTVIPVPARNHEIFPWLFSEPAPSDL